MDPPKFPTGLAIEGSPSMHQADVICDEDVTLLELIVKAYTSVVEERVDEFFVALLAVLDCDLVVRELGLPLRPWLVPTDARFASGRMPNDERELVH